MTQPWLVTIMNITKYFLFDPTNFSSITFLRRTRSSLYRPHPDFAFNALWRNMISVSILVSTSDVHALYWVSEWWCGYVDQHNLAESQQGQLK
jgi:hypothetical protein